MYVQLTPVSWVKQKRQAKFIIKVESKCAIPSHRQVSGSTHVLRLFISSFNITSNELANWLVNKRAR